MVKNKQCTNLPTSWRITVSLILKIGDILYHPVVNLGQSQPLLWGALYGFGDQVSIGEIAPCVSPGGCLLVAEPEGVLDRGFVRFPFLASRGPGFFFLDFFLRSTRPSVGPNSGLWLEVGVDVWCVHVEKSSALNVQLKSSPAPWALCASGKNTVSSRCQPLLQHFRPVWETISHLSQS